MPAIIGLALLWLPLMSLVLQSNFGCIYAHGARRCVC